MSASVFSDNFFHDVAAGAAVGAGLTRAPRLLDVWGPDRMRAAARSLAASAAAATMGDTVCSAMSAVVGRYHAEGAAAGPPA